MKKIWRFWWHISEDLGRFLWMIVGTMAFAAIIWIYGAFPRHP